MGCRKTPLFRQFRRFVLPNITRRVSFEVALRVSFEVALYRPIPKGFKLLAGDKRSAITGFGRWQT